MANPTAQIAPNPTGIHVIVVGAGFAGLTAAIECRRQGHTATLLEKFPVVKSLGDIISFGPNAGLIFSRWPGVAEQMEPISLRDDGWVIKTLHGETLLHQPIDNEDAWGPHYDGHRAEYHEIVYQHALAMGVDVRLGHRVESYFEDEDQAGVVVADTGERFVGDVVLAADGVRSGGRAKILGYEDRPKASGYAVYRTWFDMPDTLVRDPETSWLVDKGDVHVAWIGPDVHFIIATLKGGRDISWVCTHRDEADIEESWQEEAPLADARRVLEGWDPVVQKVLDHTPEPLIDWKLVYRDPLPTWTSAGKRIAVIGDAAHPFLPTSIQGASQAMEDGVTLGVCLRRAAAAEGGDRGGAVREAVATFEALRYNRVRAAQKTGEQTRDIWHRVNFDEARKNPESMRLRREAWLLNFDAERYAEEHYDETVEVLRRTGLGDLTEARNLHVPEGRMGFVEFNSA